MSSRSVSLKSITITIAVVLDRIGYSGEEVTECRTAQTKALRRAQEAMVAKGGFNWQLLTQVSLLVHLAKRAAVALVLAVTVLLTQVNAVSKSQCVDRMRSMCSEPRYQQRVA